MSESDERLHYEDCRVGDRIVEVTVLPINDNAPEITGQRVLVLGGGNVAIDVALTARRKGAKSVTLVCLESREEMPAWEYEIEEALESEIEIVNSLGPKTFFIDKSNRVSGIEFKTCTATFGSDGRFNPRYNENECRPIFGDTIIISIG